MTTMRDLLGSDPSSACTCVPGGASTADVTADSLFALLREMKPPPCPEFDALVCLPGALAGLRREATPGGLCFDRLYGVPVYGAKDAADAALIAADLKGKGKRPAVVCGPGDPQEVLELPPLVQMPSPRTRPFPAWVDLF